MKKNILFLFLLLSSITPCNHLYSMEASSDEDQNQQEHNPEQDTPAIISEIERIAEQANVDMNKATKMYFAQKQDQREQKKTKRKVEYYESQIKANKAAKATKKAEKDLYTTREDNEKHSLKNLGWSLADQVVGGSGNMVGQLTVAAIKDLVIKAINGTPLEELIRDATVITNDAVSKLQGVSNLRRNDPHRRLTEFLAGQELVWASLQVSNAIHANRLTLFEKLPFRNSDYKNLIKKTSQLYKHSQEYSKIAFERSYDAEAMQVTVEYLENRMNADMQSLEKALEPAEKSNDAKTISSYINHVNQVESLYSEGARSVNGAYRQKYRDFAQQCRDKKTEMMKQYNDIVNPQTNSTGNTPTA